MNLEELLLIDIETVPQQPSFHQLNEQWQQLWIEKSSKYHFDNAEAKDTYQERAGILAEFGRVVCISTGFFYPDKGKRLCLKVKTLSQPDEPALLNGFIELVEQFANKKKSFAFAGHNIKEFDIPFICRRLIINRIPLPKFLQLHGQKPWENNWLDTLHWWRFGDFKNYVSLKLLAAALDVASPKEELDGSLVRQAYYEKNDLAGIARYCEGDVTVLAQIILRFFNLPALEAGHVFKG